jgi:hypothetical protein
MCRGGPPNGGSLFGFLTDFVPDFFDGWLLGFFSGKTAVVRGVLWVFDGKMCGKRGLLDALFWVELGSIWIPRARKWFALLHE